MSEHKEHITQYSATDIQQYLQGKLSAAEMHAIEKAALDDPFLADAIEGMEQAMKEHEETVIVGKLQEARQEIINRTTKKSETAPVVAFRWWKVAAAAAVLIIGTVWMYNTLDTKNEKARNVAVVQPAPTTEAADSKTDSITPATAMMGNQVGPLPVTDTTKVMNSYLATKKNTNKITYHLEATKPVEVARDIKLGDLSKTKKAESFTSSSFSATKDSPVHLDVSPGLVQLSPPAAPVKPQQARKMEEITLQQDSYIKLDSIKTRAQQSGKVAGIDFEENKNQNFISGRVINENNMPMANASLYIQNYRSNYITDKSGLFKIPKDDTALDVSVAANGYTTQRFVLQNNTLAYNQLQLQTPALLNDNNLARERVSPKRGKRGEELKANADDEELEQSAIVMRQEAEPVYGWVAYEKYLLENKRKPAGDTRTGDVAISFQVGKKGELSDYKIEQSLSKAYDAEAIRIIKDGPRWKSLNSRKSRITIIVRF